MRFLKNATENKRKKQGIMEFQERMVQPFDPENDEVDQNIILGKDLKLSTDIHKTKRNTNVLVVGGSGSGKSYSVIMPNIMQMNSSFVINDPRGDVMQMTAIPLLEHGYKIRVFSTHDGIYNNAFYSNIYNPFDYLLDENGAVDQNRVKTMVDIFTKTMSCDKKNENQFWTDMTAVWLTFAVFFLIEFYPENNWNMYNLFKLTELGENNENASPDTKLDQIVIAVRNKNPKAKCFEFYDAFKHISSKTIKSIVITLRDNLKPFSSNGWAKNITTTSYLCKRDKNGFITEYIYDENGRLIRDNNNLNLQDLDDQRTALFVNNPILNNTEDFLISMMYSQMFDVCYTKANLICPHRFNIYDGMGIAMKSGFTTKEEGERYLNLCKKAEIIERNETEYQFKNHDGKRVVTEVHVKRYYLYNKDATIINTQRNLYYKDPDKNKGILMEVYNRQVGKYFLKKFQTAIVKQGGMHLSIPLRCLLDGFEHIAVISNFDKTLATMRPYWISTIITLQSFSNLTERRSEKLIRAVIGNCDTFLFLGIRSEDSKAKEYSTYKYKIGKLDKLELAAHKNKKDFAEEDIFASMAKQLLDDSVGHNVYEDEAVVFVRGFEPFIVEKYSPPEHPMYKYTGYEDPDRIATETFFEENFSCIPNEELESDKQPDR